MKKILRSLADVLILLVSILLFRTLTFSSRQVSAETLTLMQTSVYCAV
ncbi:MAG: hypothetical protein KKB51_17550 [Candidatus Riflebacteria bacterium]|nr:hypothetical protein [Candidatus Riflebacteria bacterium]